MVAPVILSKTQIHWDPESGQEENLSFKTIIPGTRLERSIAKMPEWSTLLIYTSGVWTANAADIPRCLQCQVNACYWRTDTGASQARSRLTGQHWAGCAQRLPSSSTATLLCEWVPGISPNTPRGSPKLKKVSNKVAAFQGMSRGSHGQEIWAAPNFWKKVTGKPVLLHFAMFCLLKQDWGVICYAQVLFPQRRTIRYLYGSQLSRILNFILQPFIRYTVCWNYCCCLLLPGTCDGHNESYLETMSPTACMPKVTLKSLCLNSCCHRNKLAERIFVNWNCDHATEWQHRPAFHLNL